jgi:HSP20 family protein
MALTPFGGLGLGNDLFGQLLTRDPFGPMKELDQATRSIHLDVRETDKAFMIDADIPGVDKKDIKVNVHGDMVNLKVERETGKDETKEEGGVKIHRSERSHQFVQRTVRLPETAEMEKIKASYKDGVLHLEVPKRPGQQPKQISVE